MNGHEIFSSSNGGALGIPIILDEGDEITRSSSNTSTSSYDCIFNGVLIDKDYFSSSSASTTTSNNLNTSSINVVSSNTMGLTGIEVSNYNYGDVILDYNSGNIYTVVPGFENASSNYFFDSYPPYQYGNGNSTTSNEEYYIYFEVTDSLIIGSKFNVGNYEPRLYVPNNNTNDFDPNVDDLGAIYSGNLLVPGVKYLIKFDVNMANINNATSYYISNNSNFEYNSTIIPISTFYQSYQYYPNQGYALTEFIYTNAIPITPALKFSPPVKSLKILNN